jgi:hypothetical protein
MSISRKKVDRVLDHWQGAGVNSVRESGSVAASEKCDDKYRSNSEW